MTTIKIPSAATNGTISGADGAGRVRNPLPATNNGQCNPATAREGGAGNAASHCANILAHLKSGETITGIDALNRFGCFRLPARIYDLRSEGHAIESDRIETPGGARVARYWLVAS